MINVFKILWFKKNKGTFNKYRPKKAYIFFKELVYYKDIRRENHSIDLLVPDFLKSYCTAELKILTWNCVPLEIFPS